jgi:hypothetical protein
VEPGLYFIYHQFHVHVQYHTICRHRKCSKLRTDSPGCAAPEAQGAAPLISVEHHDDGTSKYIFGEPSIAPTDSRQGNANSYQATSDSYVAEGLHSNSAFESAAQPESDVADHGEPNHMTSSEQPIQSRQKGSVEQFLGGPGAPAASQPVLPGGASDDGPLAGIPPPRRAYTMLTPREIKDQLDNAHVQRESGELHTALPDQRLKGVAAVDPSPMDSSTAAEATQRVKTTSSSTADSLPVFTKMSQLGELFCTAVEERNFSSAVIMAHTLEEHGYAPLSFSASLVAAFTMIFSSYTTHAAIKCTFSW